MAEIKKILVNRPNIGDRSQYNFDNDYSGDFIHDDSIGIPKENDKFFLKISDEIGFLEGVAGSYQSFRYFLTVN